MTDLHVSANLSKASPQLLLACAAGKHIKSAVLTGRKAGKQQTEFLTFSLSDVLVSGYQTGGATAEAPLDSISLNFSKIEMTYREQTAKGSVAPDPGRLGPQDQQGVLSASGPATGSPYDAVPYPGHPFAQTHPDRLATLATLFGLRPAAPERCRVLELGCGDGGQSRADGGRAARRDLRGHRRRAGGDRARPGARRRARAGERDPRGAGDRGARAAGGRLRLRHRARRVLVGAGRRARSPARGLPRGLGESGVAYVSYNALPGGRLREALRDMLVFHTAELTDPRERVAQARALLRFLLDGAPGEHGLGALMRDQAERMLARSDATLLHDELAEVNDAAVLPRVRRARRPPWAAVPRRGRLLRDADRRGLRAGRAGADGDRGPRAPRAVPRLPQGAHVPPDAAVPRRARDRPHAAPRGDRAPGGVHPGPAPGRARRRRRAGLRRPDGLDADDRSPAGHRRPEARRERLAGRGMGARAARPAAGAGGPPRAVRRAAAQLRRQRRRPPCAPAATDDHSRSTRRGPPPSRATRRAPARR